MEKTKNYSITPEELTQALQVAEASVLRLGQMTRMDSEQAALAFQAVDAAYQRAHRLSGDIREGLTLEDVNKLKKLRSTLRQMKDLAVTA